MRKFMLLLLSIIVFSFCIDKVYAYTSSTGYKNNPSMYLDTPVTTNTYSLKTKYNSVTANHTYVIFNDRTDLPSSFAADSSRKMHISLYEDDSAPNNDDLVKIYTYSFNGRLMDGVTYQVIDSGNLDSAGDQYGEFYLQFMLYSTNLDDCYGTSTGSFFKWMIATD